MNQMSLYAGRGEVAPPRKVAHLVLALSGAALFLFSTATIARIMDWLPGSTATSDDIGPDDGLAAVNAAELPDAATGRRHRMSKCPECGAVVSILQTDSVRAAERERAQLNAENPGRSAIYYEITIRLRDGSMRVITDAKPASWRVGERVSVIDSLILARR